MNENKEKKLEKSIIYFLCNSFLIKEIVELSKNVNCYIFNETFFRSNYTKLEIQKILSQNQIKIPKIFEISKITTAEFPVFCKENLHAGIVLKAYTKNTLIKFFNKFPQDKFYIEETINGQAEDKYYWIRGKLYSKENSKINNKVKNDCAKIAKILNLEIFSIDVIKNDKQYVVIDVNPSAGFYLLDEARNNFIKELEKEVKEK